MRLLNCSAGEGSWESLGLQGDQTCLFYLFFILLYNTVLVLPHINMNPPRVYTCSQSWTPLPPPSSYHLSGSFQCTSPKHPVPRIEPRLVIHFLYDIMHVSMPFSQIRMLEAGALGWPRGDGMGREVGGGFRIGNTCTPVADSCWCVAKPIQYCKVKNNN